MALIIVLLIGVVGYMVNSSHNKTITGIPKASTKTTDIPIAKKTQTTVASRQRSNYEAWVNFFLHRN